MDKIKLLVLAILICSYGFSQEKFTDKRDGEVYEIVTIDNTTWLAENLRFETKEGSESWRIRDGVNKYYSPKWKQDGSKDKTHGRYYSYEAALKACPTGWTLPEDSDFAKLSEKFGGDSKSGHHLKSKTDWDWTTNGDNSSGLNVKPFGMIYSSGNLGKGEGAKFWVKGKVVEKKAPFRFFSSSDGNTDKAFVFKKETYPVDKAKMTIRCVKK
jgi:uncharacterized protein (TIGR02145 family)